jgi:prevent-host-death family protein
MGAVEAKIHFGRLIDDARRKPVIITKKGRPVVVVLSIEDFHQFTGRT